MKHVHIWINFYLPTSLLYLAKFFNFYFWVLTCFIIVLLFVTNIPYYPRHLMQLNHSVDSKVSTINCGLKP